MRLRSRAWATLVLLLLLPGQGAAWTTDTAVNTPVCTDPTDQQYVAAAEDGAGGVFLAWSDDRNGTSDIYAQHLDATGAAQWPENGIPVHLDPGVDAGGVKIVSDGAGGAIFVWSGSAFYAQRLDGTGTPLWGADPVVVASGAAVTGGYMGQYYHHAVSDGAGGMIVVWEDARNGSLDHDVYAQRLDATGIRRWGDGGFALAATAAYEYLPAIEPDGTGGAFVAWKSSLEPVYQVYAQRLNASGVAQWAGGGVALTSGDNIPGESVRIAADGAGGAVVGWSEMLLDPDNIPLGNRLVVQNLDGSGAPEWTAGGLEVVLGESGAPGFSGTFNVLGDGSGGALVAWVGWYGPLPWDGPGGVDGTLIQRLAAADGAPLWESGGVFLGASYYGSFATIPLVGDGSGGAITYTTDQDTGVYLAQRVSTAGTLPWGASGTAVTSRGVDSSSAMSIVSDGDGGAIFAFVLIQNDQKDVFAQNVAGSGVVSGLETPVNVSPADGAATDDTPDLAASAFSDTQGVLAHAASQWRVHDAPSLTPDTPLAEISADNDFVDQIPLPFPFPFYGRTITAIAAGTNGMIELLEDGESSVWVGSAGNHQQDRYVDMVDAIFACNDDLDTTDGYLRVYDGGSYATVEWYATTSFDGSIVDHPMLFQVVLYPSGEIRWNFQQLDFLMYGYDLFSGLYAVGETEVGVGSAIAVQSSYLFDPGTSTVNPVTYAWQGADPVLYDSGETAVDLTTHTVPVSAGLIDGGIYYWGVRYRADNGEWTQWSTPTSFTAALPAIAVTDSRAPADDRDLSFGTVLVGQSVTETVTVRNDGTGDLVLSAVGGVDSLDVPFSITDDTCTDATLATGVTCRVSVTFDPVAAGAVTDTFDIPSNDPVEGSITITVGGTGEALVPAIVVTDSVAPANDQTVDFSSVVLSSFGTATVTVANTGTGDLTLGPAALGTPTGTSFTITEDTCLEGTLPPGESCQLTLQFAPSVEGAATNSLVIPSNDPDDAPVAVSLLGTGVVQAAPDIVVTDDQGATDDRVVDFGTVVVGVAESWSITVTNAGNASLTLGQFTLAAPFSIPSGENTCGTSSTTLPAGGSCTFTVRFTPTAEGAAGPVALDITSNDPDESTVTIQLQGTGLALPDIQVTDDQGAPDNLAIDFGEVEVGGTRTFAVTVDNVGDADLTVGSLTVVAPFAITASTCSAPLSSGSGCDITVAFLPSAVGPVGPVGFDIPSDDPDESPVTVFLTGVGVVLPDIEVSDTQGAPGDLAVQFGSHEVGAVAPTYEIVVANTGSGDLAGLRVAQTDPVTAPFSVLSDGCSGQTVPSGGDCRITVGFAPSVAGVAGPETFEIDSNDPDEGSITVTLTGAGVEPVPLTPPQVAFVTPENGTGQVGVHVGMVTATFSKAMDSSTLTPGTFTLSTAEGLVPGTVEYDPGSFTAIFRPAEPLEYATQYFASIANAPPTFVTAADWARLEQIHLWTFTTRDVPDSSVNEGACDPEMGVEDGCVNFDGFTYGTGAYSPACGPTSCTGILGIDSARRQLSQGRSSYDAPEVDTEVAHVEAGARVDATRFLVTVRSQDRATTTDYTGGAVYAASRAEVLGTRPGRLVPMTLVIRTSVSGIGSRGQGAVGVQVRDFEYRNLASVYATGGSTYNQMTFHYWPNPYDQDDFLRTDPAVSGVPSEIHLDFLFPADPGNGVFVELLGDAFRGDGNAGDVTLSVEAQLEVVPPPGVTVRLASGQTFTGAEDGDGDGVADADEDVSTVDDPTVAPAAAATGSGFIQVDIGGTDGATLSGVRTLDAADPLVNQAGRPAGHAFPDGLIAFQINGLEPGATATVLLDFPTAFTTPAYYKVRDEGFVELNPTAVEYIGSNQVRLTLVDGGEGDSDGVANGVIVDPGGVAVPETAAPLPSDDGGGGGGGCFIQTVIR